MALLCMLCMISGQSHLTHHRPWCGDSAYALGLDVLAPQTMVGAKALDTMVGRYHTVGTEK